MWWLLHLLSNFNLGHEAWKKSTVVCAARLKRRTLIGKVTHSTVDVANFAKVKASTSEVKGSNTQSNLIGRKISQSFRHIDKEFLISLIFMIVSGVSLRKSYAIRWCWTDFRNLPKLTLTYPIPSFSLHPTPALPQSNIVGLLRREICPLKSRNDESSRDGDGRLSCD